MGGDGDRTITLHEALDLIPAQIAYTTLYRWAVHGLRGRKLKTFRIGTKLYTTRNDLEEFLAAFNGGEVPRSEGHEVAEAMLDAEGI